MRRINIIITLFLFFFTVKVSAQKDPLLDIINEEMNREFEVLSKADVPAYYMDYSVNEINTTMISANLGSLINSTSTTNRLAKVNLRLGDYAKDNTHELGNFGRSNFSASSSPISLTNDKEAINKTLWQLTHTAYVTAKQQYQQVQNMEEDQSKTSDFSKEKAVRSVELSDDSNENIDNGYWETLLTEATKAFLDDEEIVSGKIDFNYTKERKYFTSTEGSYIAQDLSYAHLQVNARVKCTDGSIVPIYKTFFAFSPKDLPIREELDSEIQRLIAAMQELKKAPLAEPFTGPAILHARVAGVFFHEIFGHRIEGHRLRSNSDGQTFKEKINQKVLPPSINIFSDPSMTRYNDQDLIGAYKFDDEGIEAQKVQVVENGVLKSFLMSRSPLENFETSNGHGRCEAGLHPVARQSNLIIESLAPLSDKKLRKMLVDACKEQGKEYGYYFVDVTGGFTQTDRFNTNSFNIMPTLVYKIFVDKRPDQLVRGVDLIGTPLAMFAEITATGDHQETFTGICGAESGGVPVSATAPALFVNRIETQKKPTNASNNSPILDRPKAD